MYLVYLTVEVMSAEQEVLSSTSDLTGEHLSDALPIDHSRPFERRQEKLRNFATRFSPSMPYENTNATTAEPQSNPRSVVYLLGGEA